MPGQQTIYTNVIMHWGWGEFYDDPTSPHHNFILHQRNSDKLRNNQTPRCISSPGVYLFALLFRGRKYQGPTQYREHSNYFILLQTFVKSNECCQRPLRLPAGVPPRCNGPLIGPPQWQKFALAEKIDTQENILYCCSRNSWYPGMICWIFRVCY